MKNALAAFVILGTLPFSAQATEAKTLTMIEGYQAMNALFDDLETVGTPVSIKHDGKKISTAKRTCSLEYAVNRIGSPGSRYDRLDIELMVINESDNKETIVDDTWLSLTGYSDVVKQPADNALRLEYSYYDSDKTTTIKRQDDKALVTIKHIDNEMGPTVIITCAFGKKRP